MNILIYTEKFDRTNYVLDGGYVDIFRQTDCNSVAEDIKRYCNGVITNTGNKVWLQGLVSELSCSDNNLFYYDCSESWDEINEKYDCVVLSEANLLNVHYKKNILFLANEFRQCKIPIYVISVGAQAESYDCIDVLCKSIHSETEAFIRSVYETGGEIACRGYFTKEVLDRICKNTAEVVGCPSLFQNGRDLLIPEYKVSQHELKPIINGRFICKDRMLKRYKEALYIDQDSWFDYFYDENTYEKCKDRTMIKTIMTSKGLFESELFFDGRLKLFWDIPEWYRYLKENEYNFSIGSRIHGTVMSLLAGIPSVLCAVDSRTREIGEYYNIPFMQTSHCSNKSLFDLYSEIDYSEFNNNYSELYDKFNSFLKRHGIVNDMNGDNIFWNKVKPIPNERIEERIAELSRQYNKKRLYFLLTYARYRYLKKQGRC